MISDETRARIRRYFYAEHWKIGTIASELSVHPDAVRRAIETERFASTLALRASIVDPYAEFIRLTLEQHPRLRATRIYAMARDRGYSGSVVQLRRAVARLRPQRREAFLQLHTFPGEQAQVDWAHFGHVMVGQAKRTLSCFVATLSYSRALYLEFFFDQTTENFLRGHVNAFEAWSGQPRVILYVNLKSAVLGAPRQSHPLQPPADRVERPLSLRSTALPGAQGQSEGARGTRHSLRSRFFLGRPHVHHLGRMQRPSVTLARSDSPSTLLARWRPSHCSRCVRGRTAPASGSRFASIHNRSNRDRTLGQDHLCSLRSQ